MSKIKTPMQITKGQMDNFSTFIKPFIISDNVRQRSNGFEGNSYKNEVKPFDIDYMRTFNFNDVIIKIRYNFLEPRTRRAQEEQSIEISYQSGSEKIDSLSFSVEQFRLTMQDLNKVLRNSLKLEKSFILNEFKKHFFSNELSIEINEQKLEEFVLSHSKNEIFNAHISVDQYAALSKTIQHKKADMADFVENLEENEKIRKLQEEIARLEKEKNNKIAAKSKELDIESDVNNLEKTSQAYSNILNKVKNDASKENATTFRLPLKNFNKVISRCVKNLYYK